MQDNPNYNVNIRNHHHQSLLPNGRFFTANSGRKPAVMLKGRSSNANTGTKIAVLLGMNRCGSLPLLSAPHYLSSICTDLKKFQGYQSGGEESGGVESGFD